MIRRPPRSTLDRSSAASDVYKRQIPGRETNVLIQPQGQTWRALRVPVATIGGFLFAAALLVLAGFYLWRGPIRVRGAPSGRLVERFTLIERGVHWAVAITFTTLAVT